MDYNARIIVRGMKQEAFKGYADFRIGGVVRRFDSKNIEELMPFFMRHVARASRGFLSDEFSLIPIPNSGMAVGSRGSFRTVDLAEMFAEAYGADAKVEPFLVWDKPRKKQHSTAGFRHPDQFEPHFRLVGKPTRAVVIFDDVLTSGSQLIAAARFLTTKGFPPQCGLVAARASKTQHDPMIRWSTETFSLDRTVFDMEL
jgi:predicted amidophosphoribosyltransferase